MDFEYSQVTDQIKHDILIDNIKYYRTKIHYWYDMIEKAQNEIMNLGTPGEVVSKKLRLIQSINDIKLEHNTENMIVVD